MPNSNINFVLRCSHKHAPLKQLVHFYMAIKGIPVALTLWGNKP